MSTTAGNKTRKASTSKTKTKHKHRVGVGGVLGKLASKTKKESKNKSDTPVVDIPDIADELAELQVVNAEINAQKGRATELKAIITPMVEAERLRISEEQREYVGSVKVKAGPGSGLATFFIKNQYTGMDPSDEDQHDAAISAFAETAEVDEDDAAEMFSERMKLTTEVKFKPGSLDDPKIISLIEKHLMEHVEVKTTMVPKESFHKAASYDEDERALLDSLVSQRLIRPYSATIRPSGAPKS